jgi:hypothetical protein
MPQKVAHVHDIRVDGVNHPLIDFSSIGISRTPSSPRGGAPHGLPMNHFAGSGIPPSQEVPMWIGEQHERLTSIAETSEQIECRPADPTRSLVHHYQHPRASCFTAIGIVCLNDEAA